MYKMDDKDRNIEDLSIDNKISIVSSLLTYASSESNIYWSRNTVFFAINSAVIGYIIANLTSINPYILLIISLIGLVLNRVWLLIMKYGKYLAEKWREDAREIIKSDSRLIFSYSSLLGNPRITKPNNLAPSRVMRALAISFQFLWIILIIYSGYYIVKQLLLC